MTPQTRPNRPRYAARLAVRHHLGQLLRLLEPLERDRPDLFTDAR